MLALVLTIFGIIAFVVSIVRAAAPLEDEPTFASARSDLALPRRPAAAPRPPHRPHGAIDVSMLQLAVDHRARRFVQAALAELAKSGDTASKEGRARLLAETSRALGQSQLAWLYAGARNEKPMAAERARQEFQRLANDVRSTFQKEVVRVSDGRTVTVEAIGLRAKEHEGPGVVLVTVLVAARHEIFDFRADQAGEITTLLDQLGALSASDLVALEVIWTPAAENDRMSTAELEARHPHLVRIGGIGGRVFCGFCGGPHAAELEKCPHCGAPVQPESPA